MSDSTDDVQELAADAARAADALALGHLAAIIESSDDAILSKDLNGVIISWNTAAQRMFGYTASEMIGRPVRILIPKELQAEEDVILAKIRKGERVDHFETNRLRKDGTRFWVSITVSPIRDSAGKVVGASKIARDIGPRRDAQHTQAILSAIVDSSTMRSSARTSRES